MSKVLSDHLEELKKHSGKDEDKDLQNRDQTNKLIQDHSTLV